MCISNFSRLIKTRLNPAFLCLLCSLYTITAHADWTVLSSPTANNLNALDFPVDENTGYAVGSNGTIIKTTNGGASWSRLNSRVTEHLTDVDFVDNLNGYAVGGNGVALKTSNGGMTWSKLNTGTSNYLYAVNFPVNGNVGYIGGAGSTLLKTLDGGQTWSVQNITWGYVYDIVFPQDATTGYASTIYGTLGYIYKTTDGGATWNSLLYFEDASINSLSFPQNNQVGYLTDKNTSNGHGVWKTTDGGTTWSHLTAGIGSVVRSVDFPENSLNGIAVGKSGAILSTSDGGATWSEGNIGVDNEINDIERIDNNVAYAAGSGGIILKTTDGGSAPIEMLYMHPTASGSVNNFSHMSGCYTDWDCVNDQPSNDGTGLPATVHSLSYIGDSSGNRAMFALDDGIIDNGQSVSEICVSVAATQWYGSYASLSYQRIGIDPAAIDTPSFWVGDFWEAGVRTLCWSNLNWSAADIDALEIGVKSVAGYWLQVAQLYVRVAHTVTP